MIMFGISLAVISNIILTCAHAQLHRSLVYQERLQSQRMLDPPDVPTTEKTNFTNVEHMVKKNLFVRYD